MATTASTTTLAAAPVITNAVTTSVADPTGGAAPWSVATITTSTVTNPNTGYSANVESVFFYLRGATPTTYGGSIQADYVVGANGTLGAVDQVFYKADGSFTSVYFGSEAVNPFYAASGTTPINPGYAFTQYNYAAGGSLTQIVAVQADGRTFVGI